MVVVFVYQHLITRKTVFTKIHLNVRMTSYFIIIRLDIHSTIFHQASFKCPHDYKTLTRTVQVYHSSQQLCSAKQSAKHVSSF